VRGQQVEALIPVKRHGLRVDQVPREQRRAHCKDDSERPAIADGLGIVRPQQVMLARYSRLIHGSY
jgi:hypothetical protein